MKKSTNGLVNLMRTEKILTYLFDNFRLDFEFYIIKHFKLRKEI